MDVVEIIRRMVEIEELRANGDLTVQQDEELGYEYCQLEEDLENIDLGDEELEYAQFEEED